VVNYFFRIWIFINQYVGLELVVSRRLVYKSVFVLVILFGYVAVLIRAKKEKNELGKEAETKKITEKTENKENRKRVEWKEVWEPFRLALYNLGGSLKNLFKPKRVKKKKLRDKFK